MRSIWAVGISLAGFFLGDHIKNVDRYLLPIVAVIVLRLADPARARVPQPPPQAQDQAGAATAAGGESGRRTAVAVETIDRLSCRRRRGRRAVRARPRRRRGHAHARALRERDRADQHDERDARDREAGTVVVAAG